jgi:hypothetical protein
MLQGGKKRSIATLGHERKVSSKEPPEIIPASAAIGLVTYRLFIRSGIAAPALVLGQLDQLVA